MYPNYTNPFYMQDMRDRQPQQYSPTQNTPGVITQNFQLASNSAQGNGNFKYVNAIDDVKNELVFGDTLFITKDFKDMWFKNANGDIKTYELKERIILDEKDAEIIMLRNELAELKKVIEDATSSIKSTNEQPTTKKSTNGKSNRNNDE